MKKKNTKSCHLFRYKDRDTRSFPHILDFQEYGVTKKWVIITEISKEVENNTVGRVNEYSNQYVPRRNGDTGGSYGGGGGEECSWHCVFMYLCWNKNEKGNSRGWYAWKRVDDDGGRVPIFLILSWGRSEWGAPQVRFFLFLSWRRSDWGTPQTRFF